MFSIHCSTTLSSLKLRRAKAGVQENCSILPGIDVNIPTGKNSRQASADDTYAATLAAFKGGADGVIFSRKYSEMLMANLDAAGHAVRDAVKNLNVTL